MTHDPEARIGGAHLQLLCRWCFGPIALLGLITSMEASAGPCEVIDNGSGTAVLPPLGCGYVSPSEFHEIDVSGLPPGTKLMVRAEHDRFLCCDGPGAQCTPNPQFCSTNGGTLGGDVEFFESRLRLSVIGEGELSGFRRSLELSVFCETHTGPRAPGSPVQTFSAEMVQLQGSLVGDPDFDLLQITGGTAFGMPSPGQTTLMRLGPPGSNWQVDSFFDIAYRIEFHGAPGGALAGLSGETAPDTSIRMEAQGPPTCIPAGQDCWSTLCEGGTLANFSAHPIPAGFFDEQSEPFVGTIPLGGASAGGVDTLVNRLGDLCFYDPPWTDQVEVELVELNLVSCEPIVVEGSGIWHVQVDLSIVSPGSGTMEVSKTHSNGGTFESSFPVQPRYVFIRDANPADIRVLDSGAAGVLPVILQTELPIPWSHLEPPEQCSQDNFAPGAKEDPQGGVCCVEACHSSFGQAEHEHCTLPPGCPECCITPRDPGGIQRLIDCLSGPDGSHSGGDCSCLDFDSDGDVDLHDFFDFQWVFAS